MLAEGTKGMFSVYSFGFFFFLQKRTRGVNVPYQWSKIISEATPSAHMHNCHAHSLVLITQASRAFCPARSVSENLLCMCVLLQGTFPMRNGWTPLAGSFRHLWLACSSVLLAIPATDFFPGNGRRLFVHLCSDRRH